MPLHDQLHRAARRLTRNSSYAEDLAQDTLIRAFTGCIFGGPIARLAAGDGDRLRREVRHVVRRHKMTNRFAVWHEITAAAA